MPFGVVFETSRAILCCGVARNLPFTGSLISYPKPVHHSNLLGTLLMIFVFMFMIGIRYNYLKDIYRENLNLNICKKTHGPLVMGKGPVK